MATLRSPKRPLIWHLVERYLGRTETFIYTTLTNLSRTQPAVISYGPLANLQAFPLDEPIFGLHCRLRKLKYFPHRARYRLTRHEWIVDAQKDECEIIARSHFPRLLHAHFGPLGYRALPVKRAFNVPLITTFYGYDTSATPRDPEWLACRRELFEQGDLFLAEGPFMRQALISLGCPADRVRIQRLGIDLGRFPTTEYGRPRRKPVILFGARFVEKKGLSYGLEAIADLARAGFSFDCKIIGCGPLEPVLRAFVQQRQLGRLVQFLGSLDHSEFIEVLSNTDIFVQPSVTARDGDNEGGAPTSILEAQACGVPVVATVHADIPHIMLPEHSGLLVAERDSGALAKALARLLDRPQDRPEMGRAGRTFVEHHHDARKLAQELETVYLNYC